MIPKRLHHIWAAHNPIPYTFRANLETWQEHHPEWDITVWTEADLDELDMVNRDLYDLAKAEAPDDWIRWRSEIGRIEIMHQYGGVYADTDSSALAALDPLLEIDCWLAETPNAPGMSTTAIFGATPGHPFLRRVLDGMAESMDTHQGKRMIHRIGARYVDRVFQSDGDGVELLPWHWFASQSIKGRGKQKPVTPLYADHQYFNSTSLASKGRVAAFRAAAEVLDASGANWFLACGLVLGHIREGRILPWDMDIDIGIFVEDWDRVRAAFKTDGWPFRRDFQSQLWPFYNKTKIDIHTHYTDADSVYVLLGKKGRVRMDYPRNLFENLQSSVFYCRDVLIPSPPEEYLAHMYGEDWLTPRREWKWDESPANLTHL